MGSAAFLNEGINQLSEEYLIRKQKELNKTIPHDEYLLEKQKVKSYIANRNVFGVDLNPVAVELGEVSLWLNTIFSGGFVPWFGFQLKNGNSLIGARRETLPTSSLTSKAINPWFEQKPERITNWQKPLAVTTAKIFHFLLPDPGMANYKDKVVKGLVPDSINAIKEWQKEMLKKWSDEDIMTLKKLTAAADKLWLAWVKHLADLREQTTDSLSVFGQKSDDYLIKTELGFKDTVINKEVMSEGVKASSEYLRLKLAMDYWCALWFWPLDKTELLPSRKEWLNELSLILSNGNVGVVSDQDLPLFSQTLSDDRKEEYQNELGLVDIPQLIDNNLRLQQVENLASNFKYFHWELEFADIFAQKEGFDLILGNPPWIRVEWNESGILGEKEPLFGVKKLFASKVATLREDSFNRFPELKDEYLREYEGASATQNYLNGYVNYPELKKIQANLYKCFLPLAWRIGRGVQSFVHPEGVYDDPKGGTLRRDLYLRLRYHFQFQNETSLFAEVDHHMKYSLNVFGQKKADVSFHNVANLFSTASLDVSYNHLGDGSIPGIKDDNNKWNLAGHLSRIVTVGTKELSLFAKLYDAEGTEALEARLPALHAEELIQVLQKFANYPKRLGDLKEEYFSSVMFDETYAQRDGTIKRATQFPESHDQLIISGPHFFVGNPLYKTPRAMCKLNGDYDILDLIDLPDDYLPRTNYVSACSPFEYEAKIPRVPWEENGRCKKVTEFHLLYQG